MWSLLVEPLIEFEFLRRALLESIILSLSFSVVGLVLVTRRLSLIGDTLNHAMLPGVVTAFILFGGNFYALFFGGWITGFLLLSLSWWLLRDRRFEADSVLALFAVFSVSVGVLIASRTRTTTEILHLLFGNILAVDTSLLAISAVVGAVTWTLFILHYRSFVVALVDPQFFEMVKKPAAWVILVLLAIFAANLTVGFASLGAMMTVGLLVVPSLAGRALGKNVLSIAAISSLFGILVSWIGVMLSYHLEVPSGPAIVTVACAALGLVLLVQKLRGSFRRGPGKVAA